MRSPPRQANKARRLVPWGTQVTDETVRALAKLPKLEKLWLHDLPITDASVKILSKMKTLRELHVYATKLSPKGALHLKVALPRCKVIHESLAQ